MVSPTTENRHAKVTTGDDPDDLRHWASCHPFTQQIEVIIPSSDPDEIDKAGLGAFAGFTSEWWSGKARLSQIVEVAEECANRGQEKTFCALNSGSHDDDVWCIDPRGILTFCLCKETYETLGLVGKKLPFKGCPEQYVIALPLRKDVVTVKSRAKCQAAVKTWDASRGDNLFDVHVYAEDTTMLERLPGLKKNTSLPQLTKTDNIHVPAMQLTHRPLNPQAKNYTEEYEEELEDWTAETSDLFEWVGLACLGSQRLQANDRVDPYIAVYEPPSPSHTGNVTHLRWRGLLPPQFIQQIIDAILNWSKSSPPTTSLPFVSITAHSFLTSPTTYVPPTSSSDATKRPPFRLPRADGEDTYCIIVKPVGGKGQSDGKARGEGTGAVDGSESLSAQDQSLCSWTMIESIGHWDARWG
ncbi:hypothetical protein PLEOSDRAFT_1105479 [Pleurotus ostreatus PC15]|uniref:Uncharacterized protein n=1 Tax=Pleurotus ostreatus (strain PC15) TaxID=1137138 RepID=A0A067NHW4_PLEO1|nr:hypothetical protein PLEOSDRAFT_1105479 [Pleurotus ostreatus PC15]